jgi:putative oxidoreductase
MVQMAMFMKNITILGGALLFGYFGAGPFSFDSRIVHNVKAEVDYA